MQIKPMLASDWDGDFEKLRFPVVVQPKIDGVRACHLTGSFTGRSLKRFKNHYTNDVFDNPLFNGFDGELACQSEMHPNLCRITTSAVNSIEGEPYALWWLFDYVNGETIQFPYHRRMSYLLLHVQELKRHGVPFSERLMVMPDILAKNADEVQEAIEHHALVGFEGSILRDPEGMYKFGRSTLREQGLLRVKQFIDGEAVVEGINEGRHNGNEATINELGHTSRSSHEANMVPNGMLGTIDAVAVSDIKDAQGEVIVSRGQEVRISAGNMPHADRRRYFLHQSELLGKTVRFKFFPKGIKDKPRFPTFVAVLD